MVVDTILPNIQNFCLTDCKNLTLPSLPAQYLQINYSNEEISQDDHPINVIINSEKISLPFAKTSLKAVPIKSARILSKQQDIKKGSIEINFDIQDVKFDFQPGDTIGILPENSTEDVNLVLESLQVTNLVNNLFELAISTNTTKKGAKIPNYLPKKLTLKQLFTHFLNINAIPKKLFLRSLVEYTENEGEKHFLRTLCSKEGSKIYSNITEELSLNFLTILKLCSSCRPTAELLIEHLPRLLPRPYSIANSPLINNNEIRICFSILTDNPGLTTNLLRNVTEQFILTSVEKFYINLYKRESTKFQYTTEEFDNNLIMIGIGCAVAPYLGFLQHHLELLKQNNINGEDKTIYLFSGSKSKENSIYRNEFNEFLKQGILTNYFETFSRDENYKWNYIQEAIKEYKNDLVKLLMTENTILYVCADGAKISNSIQCCIADCIMDVNSCTKEEAEIHIKKLKVEYKYREDIW